MTPNDIAWHEDRERANHDARHVAKPPNAPPHHLRCCYYNPSFERCRLGDGHPGEHEPVKVTKPNEEKK